MPVSAFDLFKIGIGPSSSHTMGPMVAARRFLTEAASTGVFDEIAEVAVDLYGSLALTGRGHSTDVAVLLGLAGEVPDKVDVDTAPAIIDMVRCNNSLNLLGRREVAFVEARHMRFHARQSLPRHPNALRFTALAATGASLLQRAYYSIGGGFVIGEDEELPAGEGEIPFRFPFGSAEEMLALAAANGMTIAELAFANEVVIRPPDEVRAGLDRIWGAMRSCIERGLQSQGELPGPFRMRRRAYGLHQRLLAEQGRNKPDGPLHELNWVTTFAIAVNEENAAGGRVVTAPTNGAAGIIPAVLEYYRRFYPEADNRRIHDFLLTAAAVGSLYKKNASISGAEVGCQGEVGVACSMAAAGLAAVLGGSNDQIENAAEIGMEHSLGLTCDPVGGLVQIPCIERNAIGAAKAIAAAQLALSGDGRHYVSLDRVIETMRQTGADMQSKYKETALGGLAVNVTLC